MTLQANVEWDQFVRCYCIGQEDVMIMPYDPRKAYLSGEQYVHNPTYLSAELAARVGQDVLTLNRALGYDINTVEFAIKDDIPYAIDFMNPAPDAELASVGEFYHNWLVKSVTDLVFRRLAEPRPEARYRWDALLSPQPATQTATQTLAAAAAAAEAVLPQSVRDLPGNVVETVSEFLGQATGVVSGIVDAVTEAAVPGTETESKPAPKAVAKSTGTASSSKKGATKRAASPRPKKSSSGGPTES